MASGAASTSQNILVRLLKQADGNILHFAKLISTTSNLETVLLVICYTTKLLHASLARLTAARLAAAASTLANELSSKASGTLLPGETLVATIETAPDSRLLRAEQSSSAILKILDDVRTFMRLKTLLGVWVWTSGSVKNPNPDPLLRAINIGQIAGIAGFGILENTAYLASKGVISVEPKKIMPMFLWSARFWTVHVLLEFVRLWRVAQVTEKRGLSEGTAGEKAQKREDDEWWAKFLGNAAWAPLAVSWSLGEASFAGEAMVATLGGYAGWAGLIRAWKATV